MNTSRYPGSLDVLKEMTNDVLVQIDRSEIQKFSRSVGNILDFYAFLTRSHVNSDPSNSVPGFAEMYSVEDNFRPLSNNCKRQYSRTCDRASLNLGNEPEFFLETAKIPNRLIDRTTCVVSGKTLNEFCNFQRTSFLSNGEWWTQRATEEREHRPSIQNPGAVATRRKFTKEP